MEKRKITAVFLTAILCAGIRISDIKDESVMTFCDNASYVPKSITLEDLANDLFLKESLH